MHSPNCRSSLGQCITVKAEATVSPWLNGRAVSRHWIRNQDDESGPLAVVTDPIYIYRDPVCTNKQVRTLHADTTLCAPRPQVHNKAERRAPMLLLLLQ